MSNQDFRDDAFASPINVSETVYRAMQAGLTYRDLSTWCGFEAAMNVIEVQQVADYNREKIRYLSEQEK